MSAYEVKNYDNKTSALLTAIKNSSSQTYQDRVPDATESNLAIVGDAILDWDVTKNEFIHALVDRIGVVVIKNKLYLNPFKEFKKRMDYGKDIQEIWVGLIEAKALDPKHAHIDELKEHLPDVKTVFHSLNRKDRYDVTIEEDDLTLAFTGEQGMMNLINKILESPFTSANYDEFLHMKNLINVYGNAGKFHLEGVVAPTDKASAEAAMVTIKTVSNRMMFMRTDYNFAGVANFTPKKNQILMLNSDFDAIIDVNVLAAAFNMDKADFSGRKIVTDDFGGLSNVVAMIVDADWYMVYDKKFKTKQKENAAGLRYNFFLHVWQVLSVSPFSNAVMFVSQLPTLTAINVLPATATISAGEAVQLSAYATPVLSPSQCTWSHNGTDEYTYVTSLGMLVTGPDEETSPITVTATSTYDTDISDTAVITLE